MEGLFGDSSDDSKSEKKAVGNNGTADIWSMGFDSDDEPITAKDKKGRENKIKSLELQKQCSEEKRLKYQKIQEEKTLQKEQKKMNKRQMNLNNQKSKKELRRQEQIKKFDNKDKTGATDPEFLEMINSIQADEHFK